MLDQLWFCFTEENIWVLFPVPMFQIASGDNFGIYTQSTPHYQMCIPTKYLTNTYLTFNLGQYVDALYMTKLAKVYKSLETKCDIFPDVSSRA